ncbi:MAG: hypothetical protein FWG10_06780 [Eubacteriaceae bacterium]|nr:hypothetical protein [Eubacteriaceae bacterium]
MPDQKVLYHKKLIDDTVRFNSPERVPFFPHFFLWAALDAGYKISEVSDDWDLNVQVQKRFHETYKFDVARIQSGLVCHPRKMLDGIGIGFNVFNDEQESIELKDFRLLFPGEYDAFMEDRKRFLWESMLPRKFPAWNDLKVKDLVEPLEEWKRYNEHTAQLNEMAINVFHLPKFNASGPAPNPVDSLYLSWAGLEGASIDARRQPEKFAQAIALLDSESTDPFVELMKSGKIDSSLHAFDISFGMLSHNFMSIKQFGKFYWPTLKKIFDTAFAPEQNFIMHMMAQGQIIRLADFFHDLPKGHLAIQFEMENPYEMRKAMPNITAVGGMTTHYLGNSTVDECLAYAQQLVNDLGSGEGGFILAPDKMMSYRRDAKGENLKAVCDYIAQLSVQEEGNL